jgi:hypothetical protein
MDFADVMLDEDILCDLMDPTGAAHAFPWERCSYRLLDGSGETYRASPSPQIEPHIEMERLPLLLGYPPTWTYYKNCILPRITVRVHGAADAHAPPLPDRASVLLSAVTLNAATGTAVSCGLDGDVHQPLVHGACSFASISFKTTSYNLKGKPVHLLVSLLAPEPTTGADEGFRGGAAPTTGSNEGTQSSGGTGGGGMGGGGIGGCGMGAGDISGGSMGGGGGGVGGVSGGAGAHGGNTVLASFLSPPLRVDARKRQTKERLLLTSATGKGGQGQSPADATAVTLTPFAPEVLERRLEKVGKPTDGGGKQLRSPIDNTMEGLRAYLSAVNIRPKCKHPLFLVLRFDACVGLYYDTSRTNNPAEDVEAFQRMMQILNIAPSNKESITSRGEGGGVQFIVATKPGHERPGHECGKTDCPVRLSAAISLSKGSDLPRQYQMLSDHQLGALRRTYCRLYDAAHIADPNSAQQALAQRQSNLGNAPPPCSTCGVQDPPLLPLRFGQGGDSAVVVPHSHHHHMSVCPASVPKLLGVIESFIAEGAEDVAGEGGSACPQDEWERGLALMAAALSQHCRTRSAAEVIAFMRESPDERQRKRMLAL